MNIFKKIWTLFSVLRAFKKNRMFQNCFYISLTYFSNWWTFLKLLLLLFMQKNHSFMNFKICEPFLECWFFSKKWNNFQIYVFSKFYDLFFKVTGQPVSWSTSKLVNPLEIWSMWNMRPARAGMELRICCAVARWHFWAIARKCR